jgi:hypothetical protein
MHAVIPRPSVEEAHATITAHFARPDAKLGIDPNSVSSCVYRGEQKANSPIKCGVGVLIPDEMYRPEMDAYSDSGIGSLLGATRGYPGDDSEEDELFGDLDEGDELFPELAGWDEDAKFVQFLAHIQLMHDTCAGKTGGGIDELRDQLAKMDLTKYQS